MSMTDSVILINVRFVFVFITLAFHAHALSQKIYGINILLNFNQIEYKFIVHFVNKLNSEIEN
jgi:hypothetical protein